MVRPHLPRHAFMYIHPKFLPVPASTFICHQSAAIIMPDADLSLAVPAVFFGSVGTAGQRCTSTRRLYLHRAIAPEFLARLQALYASPALQPGDPLDARTLLGPLHSRAALKIYDDAITELKDAGAEILGSTSGYGRYENLTSPLDHGNFVRPAIAAIPKELKSRSKFESRVKWSDGSDMDRDAVAMALWAKERFVPVLCVAEFEELDEAIARNNAVPQGLSSSLWTRDVRHVGKWIGPAGSDTGIVNVGIFVNFLFWGDLVETFFVGQRRYERCRNRCSIWRKQGQFFSVLQFFFRSNVSTLRARGGAVNPGVTLGNNMYAGAHVRSTFPTRHPLHKVSTSPHHDNV